MTDPTGSVLIVEDESALRFIVSANLRASGFEVFEAENGAEAIEVATQRLPDVIIMDIGLPVLDGLSATRALKADKRTAHIPVVILTGRTSSQDVVRGLEAGAQEYLHKPFDVTELLARVQTVFRLATARRDLNRLNTQLAAEVGSVTQRLKVLYEFMRDLNQADSRDRILDLLVHCVEETTGAKRISLFLRDATGEYLVCERAVGIDKRKVENLRVEDLEGITGRVFHTGKTLAARTYANLPHSPGGYVRDAFLSTPLVTPSVTTKEGIIGVLNVTEKSDDAPFSDEEIDGIRSIADAAGIALESMLRRERMQQSVRVLLQTLGHLAEYRDEETTLHLERVSKMSRILASELAAKGPHASAVTEEFIELLVQAAPMHDIGKVGIPDEILTKPGALTAEEFQIMKTHADIGRRVLSRAVDPTFPVPLLQMCVDIAHSHHERFDGSGYPQGLAGKEIPLAARIIALVDAYDAITSRRRYKEAKSHEEAVETIRTEARRHFDPVLVDAFLRSHNRFDNIRARCEEQLEPAGAVTR